MIQRLTLALLLVVVGMLGWAFWRWSPTPTLDEIVGALRSDKVNLTIENTLGDQMQTVTTTVVGQSGNSYTITTTRLENETKESWFDRHIEAVDAAREL